MQEVLSHPLGPLPWSLAATDNSLKNTLKTSLAKESAVQDLCRLQNCGKGYEDQREAFAEIDYESDYDE